MIKILLLAVTFSFFTSHTYSQNLENLQYNLQNSMWYTDGIFWEKNGVGRGYELSPGGKPANELVFFSYLEVFHGDSTLSTLGKGDKIDTTYGKLAAPNSGYYAWDLDSLHESGDYFIIYPNYIYLRPKSVNIEGRGTLYKLEVVNNNEFILTSIIPNDFGYQYYIKKQI